MHAVSFSHSPYRFQLPASTCAAMLGCAWILGGEHDARIQGIRVAAEGYG